MEHETNQASVFISFVPSSLKPHKKENFHKQLQADVKRGEIHIQLDADVAFN
jgi:hypothetical protein